MHHNFRFRASRAIVSAFLLLLFCCCGNVFAQTGTSNVRGTIVDAQGNAVAGATVTLINAEKNFSRTQTTNEQGGYVFTAVPPGTYRVEAEVRANTINLSFKHDNEQNPILIQSKAARSI